jgi:hypothetical protein
MSLVATPDLLAQVPLTPATRIGILGDPTHHIAWSDAGLEKLKTIGFNEIQLNIAWGSHPTGDPITLIDVVTVPSETELPGTAERRAELRRRVAMARAHGLRTLFHLGSPYMDHNPYTGEVSRTPYRIDDATTDSWYDILNPKVRDHEIALLAEFRRQFPDVDDILVYTYDVEAWQTPEFQYTHFSFGVPLADRLPGYLAALHRVWVQGRTGKARMWWEPWELSAGEIYTMLPRLPRTDFGLILHSNIAEAQLALPVDVWFRNTARMSLELGIPVLAHAFFASASEEIETLSIPAPRLVDEEYLAFLHVPGVSGIKEYYGFDPSAPDLDVDLLQARLRSPSLSTEELLTQITRRFGAAQTEVRRYLDLLSDALQTYPWDASWFAREVGRASVDHGWSAATIRGAEANTPSWKSTRHARFMKMDKTQPHFWMLEDVQLRCQLSADILDRAAGIAARLQNELADANDRLLFQHIENDVDIFRHVTRSYALHLRETNVAEMLRQDISAGRPLNAALAKELSQLLDADVANQNSQGRVVQMRRLYRDDPTDFIRRYLIPTDLTLGERGNFSLTTR